MRSRLFHTPLLHSPHPGEEKKVTWLELFFDLIFVAAFIQLGNGLSKHPTPAGTLAFVATFVPLWVAWSGFTFYENRYTIDDFLHRAMVFAQMFAVGGMAVAVPGVLDGHMTPFALASSGAQLIVALLYWRAYKHLPKVRAYSLFWGSVFSISSTLWFISAWVHIYAAIALWVLATLVVLWSPLSKRSRALADRLPIDFEHLGERYGLLTLIVLGESFVKVVGSLASDDMGVELYAQTGIVLLLTCCVWWIYFDDVAGSTIRKGPGKWVIWLYAHIPLQGGITGMGVAIKKAVHFTWLEPAPEAYRWLLAGSIASVFFAVAAIDSVTERHQAELSDHARINTRWMSALVILLLAPAGAGMSGGTFLALIVAITVAQVVFDLAMAPFEEAEHMEKGERSIADVDAERRAGKGPSVESRKNRPDISTAVRKGTPSNLRGDLYFYLVEGSWTRVFVAFSFIFVTANVFFAALYMLEPGSIHNSQSFADAFFFSVQTMSTVGYGGLLPATNYANAIVSIEAGLSVIGVAVITGLVFAKVSRAKASVLFSDSLVVTKMHGKLMLMLRVGNARSGEVVDANVVVTALFDEVSEEGHHIRRLKTLRLVRSNTPIFVLSWTVMHEIDEDSPFVNFSWDDILDETQHRLVSLIVTLVGHDGTYGQTIYSRHIYFPEDIRLEHRFVDVLSQLEDGRMMIDYTKFHDTIAES